MRVYLSLVFAMLSSGCMVAPYTKYMASELRIRIVESGIPVEGARITREATVQGGSDSEIQHAVSNQDGWAVLPDITRLGIVQSIATWVYTQRITVKVGDAEYLVWQGGKVGAERFDEDFPMKLKALIQVQNGDLVYVFDLDKSKTPNKAPRQITTSVSLSPEQAILAAMHTHEGMTGNFLLEVRSSGRKDGFLYLNSEIDYRDEKCLTIAIPSAIDVSLRNKIGSDPMIALNGKRIKVTGTAQRVKIWFYRDGVRTDTFYHQTHVRISDIEKIEVIE